MGRTNFVEVYRSVQPDAARAAENALVIAGIRTEAEEVEGENVTRLLVSREDEVLARNILYSLEVVERDRAAPATRRKASGSGMTNVGRLIAVMGVACILFGLGHGFVDYLERQRYPVAVPVTYVSSLNERLVEGDEGRFIQYSAVYRYQVAGEEYSVLWTGRAPDRFEYVYVDPDRPEDAHVGPLTHPAAWSLLGSIVGGLLIFVAYQFRMAPKPGDRETDDDEDEEDDLDDDLLEAMQDEE